MKSGARLPFNKRGAGTQVLEHFLTAIHKNNSSRATNNPLKLHLIGHSTGAILLGWLLYRMHELNSKSSLRISSTSLLAPAASIDFYQDNYHKNLTSKAKTKGIDELFIYNLSQKLELDDTVGPYRKSLLYLVSRAFEETKKTPILGMQKYAELVPKHKNLKHIISDGIKGSEPRTWSETHGGFDNDVRTMNNLLKNMLKKAPKRLFTEKDLEY